MQFPAARISLPYSLSIGFRMQDITLLMRTVTMLLITKLTAASSSTTQNTLFLFIFI